MTTVTTNTLFPVTASIMEALKPKPSTWKVEPQSNGDIRLSSDAMRVTVSKGDGGQVRWETLDSAGRVTAEGMSTGDPHDSARRAGENGPGQRFDSSGDQKIVLPAPPPDGTTMLLKRVTDNNQKPLPGQKAPTWNGELELYSERDGYCSVKNIHGPGPLKMGPPCDDPIFLRAYMQNSWANTMAFDPVKGRMVDPQTGEEITQVHVDRNDLVRGGPQALSRAFTQSGADFSAPPNAPVWKDPKIWEEIDTEKLPWLSKQDAQKQPVEKQLAPKNKMPMPSQTAWTLDRFIPGAPAIPMPKISDCPPGTPPLRYACSELMSQRAANQLHQDLTTGGVQSIEFLQPKYGGGAIHYKLG